MKKIYMIGAVIILSYTAKTQWNSNTSINLEAAGVNAADIATAGATDGKTWIAFYSQNGSNYDMRAQLLDANGNKLLGNDGIVVGNKKSGSATFVFNACVDNENNFVIAFQYEKSGNYIINAHKIDQAGNQLWGTGGIDLGNGLAPWPAALSNNDIIIAWVNNDIINYQKISPSGAVAWAPVKEISVSSASVTRPQLVANTNNTFGIVYQRVFAVPFYTHLWEQRYDIDGNPIWVNAVQINNSSTAVFHYYSVLSNADTTYIGYSGNPQSNPSRFDAFLERVNADGNLPWGINGTDFSTDSKTYYELSCEIAYQPGGSAVWAVSTLSDIAQGQHGISAQKFDDATGVALLGPKGKNIFPVSANFESDENISLCSDGPVFTFTDASNKLFATKLDANGNFAWTGNKIELGSTTNSKGRFGFTQFVNDQAVAVWAENKEIEDRPYAQNISCDGQTGILLPVTLLDFHGGITGKVALLSWQTRAESNNKGFYTEQSVDDIHFNSLGFTASKAQHGNSNALIDYSFTDAQPASGNNYYRLKQEDFDAHYTYSNTILVKNTTVYSMKMHSVYPDPVYNTLSVYIESIITDKVSFIVCDAAGKVMMQQTENIMPGNNNIQLNVSTLATGNYFIKAISSNTCENARQHFIKQ